MPAEAASVVSTARAALAEAYLRIGDYDAVDDTLGRAVEVARATGDRKAEAAVTSLQGMTLHFRAIDLPPEERAAVDPAEEQALFELALVTRREIEDHEGIAESLFQLGLVHQVLRGDMESGSPLFREALRLLGTLPEADALLRSEVHRHVGLDLLVREERLDEAIEHLGASLALREGLAERGWPARSLSLAERLAGRPDDAVAFARQALEHARTQGLRARFTSAAGDALRAAEESRGAADTHKGTVDGGTPWRLVIHNPPRRACSALFL